LPATVGTNEFFCVSCGLTAGLDIHGRCATCGSDAVTHPLRYRLILSAADDCCIGGKKVPLELSLKNSEESRRGRIGRAVLTTTAACSRDFASVRESNPGQESGSSVDWAVNRRPEADSSSLVSKLVDVSLMSGGGMKQAAIDFAAKEVIKEFHMTNLADRRSYNFGDTFGDPVETDSVRGHARLEGIWCNQADGTFEEDDAVREQGGAA